MPLDFGVSVLLTQEYARFMESLGDLRDGGRRRARAAAARIDPGSPVVRPLHFPDLDEVFTIAPRPAITREMMQVHYGALRRGDPSPLAPELQAEIVRRASVADRIRRSSSPHWAQAYGSALTAVDNVQDLLTTLVTVGKLTLGPVVRMAERGLPTVTRPEVLVRAAERAALLAAQEQGISSVARAALQTGIERELRATMLREASQQLLNPRRLLSRGLVPVFGTVMLASDILKLATALAMMAFPAYAAYCGGGPAAMAAGVPSAVFGSRLKAMASLASGLNPFSRRAQVKRSAVFRNLRPSIYNLMEVAQTSQAMTGVGMVFGGFVGFAQDASFGLSSAARGDELRLETPGHARAYYEMQRRAVDAVPSPPLEDLRAAAALLQLYPFMLDAAGPFTVAEKIEASVAAYAALELLAPWYDVAEKCGALELLDTDTVTPPAYRAHGERDRAAAAGHRWLADLRWPIEGAPRRITTQRYLEEGAAALERGLYETLLPIRDTIEGQLLAALAARLYERSVILLTGSADSIAHELTPEHQVLESMALAGLLINRPVGDAINLAFFAAGAERMRETGRRSLSPQELLTLSAATGAQLIPTLPSDAPAPKLP